MLSTSSRLLNSFLLTTADLGLRLPPQWLQKRRLENAGRRAAGEDPLPEEDLQQFRPIPEPSQLDSFLLSSQIGLYCDQLTTYASTGLEKLHLMDGLQQAL